jgi:hypothetical protein
MLFVKSLLNVLVKPSKSYSADLLGFSLLFRMRFVVNALVKLSNNGGSVFDRIALKYDRISK